MHSTEYPLVVLRYSSDHAVFQRRHFCCKCINSINCKFWRFTDFVIDRVHMKFTVTISVTKFAVAQWHYKINCKSIFSIGLFRQIIGEMSRTDAWKRNVLASQLCFPVGHQLGAELLVEGTGVREEAGGKEDIADQPASFRVEAFACLSPTDSLPGQAVD